ncbi:uncharacterized protein BDZ99DRAFT_470841 [Mytilinidion resinicola]|uniref:Uncharacterized protein n=1 Tax=Mytilinidion resinicola TaxID=574789 RepID=A0A6A6ZA56_9PEZI|nr:uncharacterized protein BDZ99DRAFT_470841 [Mytilinidion resinicola]KAF2817896.1 hypothetical protein BDZ99DRAFT_470841 [Mytilinidion resinicola]
MLKTELDERQSARTGVAPNLFTTPTISPPTSAFIHGPLPPVPSLSLPVSCARSFFLSTSVTAPFSSSPTAAFAAPTQLPASKMPRGNSPCIYNYYGMCTLRGSFLPELIPWDHEHLLENVIVLETARPQRRHVCEALLHNFVHCINLRSITFDVDRNSYNMRLDAQIRRMREDVELTVGEDSDEDEE